MPAVRLVQAPVFYGHAFAAWAEVKNSVNEETLTTRLNSTGFKVVPAGEPSPSNLSAAGETQALITAPERDRNVARGYCIWSTPDNFGLASVNGTRIAER